MKSDQRGFLSIEYTVLLGLALVAGLFAVQAQFSSMGYVGGSAVQTAADYEAVVSYDSDVVHLMTATPGASPFETIPTIEANNTLGIATITGDINSSVFDDGTFNAFNLSFQAVGEAGDSSQIAFTSIVVRNVDGDVLATASGSPETVTLIEPGGVPGLEPWLAIALAVVLGFLVWKRLPRTAG